MKKNIPITPDSLSFNYRLNKAILRCNEELQRATSLPCTVTFESLATDGEWGVRIDPVTAREVCVEFSAYGWDVAIVNEKEFLFAKKKVKEPYRCRDQRETGNIEKAF